jgi:hypothetical protein
MLFNNLHPEPSHYTVFYLFTFKCDIVFLIAGYATHILNITYSYGTVEGVMKKKIMPERDAL